MNSFNISLGIAAQYSLAFTYLGTQDLVSLIHPAFAVILVFPILGIVSNLAWQTRQRRLQLKDGNFTQVSNLGHQFWD